MLSLIIYLVLFIFVIYLLHKCIKSVIVLILLGFLIILLSIGAVGYFVVQDAIELKQGFVKEPKLFLLKDGDSFLSGFQIIAFESDTGTDKDANQDRDKSTEEDGNDISSMFSKVLNQTRLEELADYFESDDYDKIKGKNFKIFIIDMKTFEKLPEDFAFNTESSADKEPSAKTEPPEFGEKKDDRKDSKGMQPDFSKVLMIKMLRSDNPVETLLEEEYDNKAKDRPPKEELENRFENQSEKPEELKAMLFFMLTAGSLKQGPVFIIQEMKEKNIIIYPETIIFSMIKETPLGLISRGVGVVKEKMEKEE